MTLTDHKYQLRKDLFDLDALVFDGGQIRQAGIVMPDGSDYLTLLCDGFPNFGIWAAREHLLCAWNRGADDATISAMKVNCRINRVSTA